jgi:hypothetical protein
MRLVLLTAALAARRPLSRKEFLNFIGDGCRKEIIQFGNLDLDRIENVRAGHLRIA